MGLAHARYSWTAATANLPARYPAIPAIVRSARRSLAYRPDFRAVKRMAGSAECPCKGIGASSVPGQCSVWKIRFASWTCRETQGRMEPGDFGIGSVSVSRLASRKKAVADLLLRPSRMDCFSSS